MVVRKIGLLTGLLVLVAATRVWALSAPQNMQAVALSASQIQVSWQDPNQHETGYSVERSTMPTTGFVVVGTTPNGPGHGGTVTFQDAGLTCNTTFYYQVRAFAGSSFGPYGAVASAKTAGCSTTSTTTTTLASTTTTTHTTTTTTTIATTTTTTVATTTTTTVPDTTPPSQPGSFTANASGTDCTQVALFWSASTDSGGSGLFGYRLYRNGSFVRTIQALATSNTDTGLTGSTLYNYQLSAIDNAGNESTKASASATTIACADTTPPTVPTNVTATPHTCVSVVVQWTASTDSGSGMASYKVYRGGTFLLSVPSSSTAATDSAAPSGTTSTYQVSAVDKAGNESAKSTGANATTATCPTTTTTNSTTTLATSSTTSTTTTTTTTTAASTTTATAPDTTPPSVPGSFTATPASCSQINLSWSASTDSGSGVKGYNIYKNGSFLKQITAPTTSTSDTGLLASTLYSYGVAAIDNAGNQSVQATGNATTPACPTTTVTTTTTTSTTTTTTTTTSTTTATTLAGSTTSSTTTTTLTTTTTTHTTTTTSTTTTTTTTTTSTTTTTLTNINPTLVGFVPGIGTAHDVSVHSSGSPAYVASSEFGVSVVDVTSPATPVAEGGANPAFFAQNVAISGTLAVTANIANGFSTVDLTSVTAPLTKGTVAGTFTAVALAGTTTAYALQVVPGNPAHTDLVAVNVTTPTSPSIIGRVTLAGGTGLKIVSTKAYVATGQGLQVVDITTPSAPAIVGAVTTPLSTQSKNGNAIAISGTCAYVAENNVLRVFDITTPTAPTLSTSITTGAAAVAVDGTRLYVVTGGSTLAIYDITTPLTPTLLGTGTSADSAGFVGVAAKGNTAYTASPSIIAGTALGGLYAWNVTTPSAPVVLGHSNGLFDSWDISQAGATVVATGNAAGLKIVDVTTPAAPVVRAVMAGTMRNVCVVGTKAYVQQVVLGNPSHTDLLVVDITTPASPTTSGRVTLAGGGPCAVSGDGNTVYVATGGNILMVDVTTPSAPAVLGAFNTGGTSGGLSRSGTKLYVADGTALRVLDITAPTSPTLAGSFTTASAVAVAALGTNVALVDGSNLKLIDASVPSTMVLKSTSSSYNAQAVTWNGNLVFLVTGQSKFVTAVNATNMTAPSLVRQVAIPGGSKGVVAGGNYVYAGDQASVADVVQVMF